jgi:NAD-dependent dihydropyrimidine dehydrogenase PreA subunit
LIHSKIKLTIEDVVMAEETWHGIPRSRIPWCPTINYEECVACGKCVDFCHMKVFGTEEVEGKKRTVVQKRNSCIVTCTGCNSICPTGAISHPSKKEFLAKIRELRKTQEFRFKEQAKK